MAAVLEEICAKKRLHVAQKKQAIPRAALEIMAADAELPRGFYKALKAKAAKATSDNFGLICEIKKASPSKGLIRANFDPPTLAEIYAKSGATCLSVLTDTPYFQGEDLFLQQVKQAVSLPCLRKDFMVDPYQIIESRALGADCILLILSALKDSLARELEDQALSMGMDVLIEVHDAPEMERALAMQSPLIGVNNRNLKTMQVSTDTTLALAPMGVEAAKQGRETLCVGESGLSSHDDLLKCQSVGVTTFLIGESFMRQKDVGAAVKSMLGKT